MLTRTETPERWLTSLERRASCDSSARISRMNGGTSTGIASARSSSKASRSWSMIAISTSVSSG